jgi:hypothetical protein
MITRGGLPLLLLLLSACAGTQSQQAFIPRPAAAVAPLVTTPNRSAAREHSLDDALECSLREQEERDETATRSSPMPHEPAVTRESSANRQASRY